MGIQPESLMQQFKIQIDTYGQFLVPAFSVHRMGMNTYKHRRTVPEAGDHQIWCPRVFKL